MNINELIAIVKNKLINQINIENIKDGSLEAHMEIAPHHMAPNGFLHGGAVVTFADSACGCATFAHLPKEAKSFATITLSLIINWTL